MACKEAVIYDASQLPDQDLQADLCVIGSGAGGAMVAMVAAEAGLRVIVLEAGGFFSPDDMTQREEQMLPRLYWQGGGRTTRDRRIHIHQGKGVGGSTLHNLNLCKRIPEPVLRGWIARRGLQMLPLATWNALYAEVETLLEVSEVPRDRWSEHNLLVERGVQALGWRGGGLRHNRTGCNNSGFCEIGCAYDGKNNAAKVLVPRAVRAGCRILAHCQAVRVLHSNGQVSGVEAVAVRPDDGSPLAHVRVRAPRVCLAASATATAALLLRSQVPDPGGETGKRLHIHPAVVAAGEFAEPVRAWQGIPQTYECTEFLNFSEDAPADKPKRLWIIPAFGHPMGVATMMPGSGALHRSLMQRYDHLAVLTAMLHDGTSGTVAPDGDQGLAIDYQPDAKDRAELVEGLRASARLLFAAGAQRVWIPTTRPMRLDRLADLRQLDGFSLTPDAMELTAVHPMGSVPMGDDPRIAAVGSDGRHHHLRGLWIGDGSLFPTSIGVPPQLSIYALGLHVGRAIAAHT